MSSPRRSRAHPLASRRARLALAAAVTVAVVVASLVPLPPGPATPSGPLGLVGLDKWAHVGGYAALVAALAGVGPARSRRALGRAALAAAALGLVLEGLQAGVPGRTFALGDLLANVAGSLAAAVAWEWLGVGRRLAAEMADGTAPAEEPDPPPR